MPVHVHSGAADKTQYGPHVGIYVDRGPLVVEPGPCGSCSGRACSSASPGCGSSSPSAGAFWAADLLWMMDTVYDREHGARKLGAQL